MNASRDLLVRVRSLRCNKWTSIAPRSCDNNGRSGSQRWFGHATRQAGLARAEVSIEENVPDMRARFEQSIVKKNMFFMPAFQIYLGKGSGDLRGLYDLGPLGCALQHNIVDVWRKHFVLEEDMLEIDCTAITPHNVLQASGHVDRFTDWICEDLQTETQYRVDHLLRDTLQDRLAASKAAKPKPQAHSLVLANDVETEYNSVLARIDSMTGEQLKHAMEKYNIRSPTSNGELSPPKPFNLMFKSNIGARHHKDNDFTASDIFLRPETAQGQFVNFNNLFRFNNNQPLPFASASVGKCYRNEIAPRSALLRTREFLLAEIEHYVDPDGGKTHARFPDVALTQLRLLSRQSQNAEMIDPQLLSVSDAVSRGTIANETLGYFLARIQLFLHKCGIDPAKLRFRQHTETEMAHYATDCWDAEVLTSHGWIECVGCADRAAYDLTQHSVYARENIQAKETIPLDQQREIEEYRLTVHQAVLGPRFRGARDSIQNALLALKQDDLQRLQEQLSATGSVDIEVPEWNISGQSSKVSLTGDMITVEKVKYTPTIREFTPHVVEPSFGIGRILMAALEHSFAIREDKIRPVLSLPPPVAPVKVMVATLMSNPELAQEAKKLTAAFRNQGLVCKTDESGNTIGTKYTRSDEMGVPLVVTVDYDTLKDQRYTLRDRDSMAQVRATEPEILQAVRNLVELRETWPDITARLPTFKKATHT